MSIEKNADSSPTFRKESSQQKKIKMKENEIFFMDCRKGLKTIKTNSIDHFYADPPFDIKFNSKEKMYKRNKSNVIEGYIEPSGETYYDFSKSWINECARVLKKDGTGWICSGWSNLADVLNAIKKCDLNVLNHVIWKYQFGVYTKKKFITSHYHLLFVIKNKKNWYFNKDIRFEDKRTKKGNKNYLDREDVWIIKRPYNNGIEKNANTQPLELVMKALQYTTKEGDLILDPFMGGATTALAAIKLNRRYIGFEINKNLKELQERRIKDVISQRTIKPDM